MLQARRSVDDLPGADNGALLRVMSVVRRTMRLMAIVTERVGSPPMILLMAAQAERFRVPRGLSERRTQFMEVYQTSWVQALAAASGCVVWEPKLVDDGIDVTLEHRHETHTSTPERAVLLKVQLKATTIPPSKGFISVKVSRQRHKQYAVADPHISTIVVALHMPMDQENWVYAGHRSLSMFGRSAWVNLAGVNVDEGDPSDKLTVKAPLRQPFDDVSLAQIMERIGKGGQP